MDYIDSLGFLADCGVHVQMVSRNAFDVYGFYKSNKVTVNLMNRAIYARYDEETTFDYSMSLEEQLLIINKEWWERSRFRWDGWREMSPSWKLVELKLKGIIP